MNMTGYRVNIEAAFIPDMNDPATIGPVKEAADKIVAEFKASLEGLKIDARMIKASVDFQPTMRVPAKPEPKPADAKS